MRSLLSPLRHAARSPAIRRRSVPPQLVSTASSKPPPPPPRSSPAAAVAVAVSDRKLEKVRRLVPMLCASGNLQDAINLVDAALLAGAPPSSLPLETLADRLADPPDTAAAMSFLAALRDASQIQICSLLLISSYLRHRRPKEAAEIVAWLCRLGSPRRPGVEIYGAAVAGFCRIRKPIEALRAIREMIRDGAAPTPEMREAVRRGLMWDARVDEARELDDALRCATSPEEEDGGGDRLSRPAKLLDRIIADWKD